MALAALGPAGEGVEDGMEAPKPKEAPPDAFASSCSSLPHLPEPMAAPRGAAGAQSEPVTSAESGSCPLSAQDHHEEDAFCP